MPLEQPRIEKPRVVVHFGNLFDVRGRWRTTFEIPGVGDVLGAPVRRKRHMASGTPAIADADILPKQSGGEPQSDDHA